MQLGDILVEQGKLTADELTRALQQREEQGGATRLGDWLVQQGLCSEMDVLEALGKQFNTVVLPQITEDHLDSSLVSRLPVDWARNRTMLPIRLDGRIAAVTSDPTQIHHQETLALLLQEELITALAPAREIERGIEWCYYNKESGTGEFLRTLEPAPEDARRDPGSDDLLRMADNAPVTQLINLILLDAMKSGASDIHIEPYQKSLRMRFRIDGILYEKSSPPKHLEAALVSRLKVMAHLDIAEKRMPQDGTARVRIGERELDIRTSTVPVAEGERIVLRLLNRESTLLPLYDLGMSAAMLTRFQALLAEPFGVIWVTGPTGSGKTTTLYAALQELDTNQLNVITIEDPVEYQLPTISQIGIKPKIGLTFARGLRHILRQDPDVILVGETRDLETAEIVVRSSLTGHLVFSTLHTNDAISAAVRLIDMGIEPYLVAAATRAAMAQRLVRQLCPHCRTPTLLSDEMRTVLGARAQRLENAPLWAASGCEACSGGYKGRIGLFELVELDGDLQDIIREGANLRNLRRAAAERGMATLLDDGIDKALEGRTSIEEVLRVVGHGSDAP
jgi:general secretion pathway protein E